MIIQSDQGMRLDEAHSGNVERIRVSVFEAMFCLLDGFEWQAAEWRDPDSAIHYENVPGWLPENHHMKLKTSVSEQRAKFGQFVSPECSNFVETIKPKDFRNQDERSFMILSNIWYLKKAMIPASIELFHSKFHSDITLDCQHFTDTCSVLERIIIFNYTKRQNTILKKLVKESIFFSGLDWASLQSPREIRPHTFHILHHLVYIHASISQVSQTLVKIILSEVLLCLSQEIMLSFRQVDRFNVPGMLQATLETEFLDSTLKCFESKQSSDIFTQIYENVERGTDLAEKIEPSLMNSHLMAVKTFLQDAKTSTYTQFRCFVSVSPFE